MASESTTITRAQQSEETKARILEHALTAFAEKGFEGTSIRDIANSAGLNHGLLRYHFVNKEIMWKHAVDFLFERQVKYLRFSIVENATMSVRERVVAWIHRYVRYCAEHPEHARIMISESMVGGTRFEWQVDQYIRPAHKMFLDFLNEAVEEKVLPAVPLPTLLYSLIGSAQTVFVLANEVDAIHDCCVYSEQQIQSHADAIVKLFILPEI